MNLELAGKTAIITGASRGIGRATAIAFAHEGANVGIVARDVSMLKELRRQIIEETGVDVIARGADLSRATEVKAMVAEFSDAHVLVNNAGAIPSGSIDIVDEQRWREAWDLKVFGYIDSTRAMLAHMYERRAGVIVNVIGMGGLRHQYQYVCGSTANAALIAFTNAVGAHSVDYGVRVLGINPGTIDTDRHRSLTEQAIADPAPGAARTWERSLNDDLPFGRKGTPAEMADAIVYLASGRASYISGTVINADAGWLNR